MHGPSVTCLGTAVPVSKQLSQMTCQTPTAESLNARGLIPCYGPGTYGPEGLPVDWLLPLVVSMSIQQAVIM